MATLTGNQIDQSYSGLIKTSDNAAIGTVEKEITDGTGVSSTLKLGTTSASFVGTLDLTGATVTGLPAAGGLVIGTGTNSLQNGIGGVSNASGPNAIALGNAASASGNNAMAYGDNTVATGGDSAAFGQYAEAVNNYAIAFGRTSVASGDGSVAFGQQAQAAQAGAVAMGRQVTSDTADTTHVRALKIVAPSGGTGGNGITMLSPNGTAYTLTVSNAGALVIS